MKWILWLDGHISLREFQITVQGKRTQPEPKRPPELMSYIWEFRKTKTARSDRIEHQRGENFTEWKPWRPAESPTCIFSRRIRALMWKSYPKLGKVHKRHKCPLIRLNCTNSNPQWRRNLEFAGHWVEYSGSSCFTSEK